MADTANWMQRTGSRQRHRTADASELCRADRLDVWGRQPRTARRVRRRTARAPTRETPLTGAVPSRPPGGRAEARPAVHRSRPPRRRSRPESAAVQADDIQAPLLGEQRSQPPNPAAARCPNSAPVAERTPPRRDLLRRRRQPDLPRRRYLCHHRGTCPRHPRRRSPRCWASASRSEPDRGSPRPAECRGTSATDAGPAGAARAHRGPGEVTPGVVPPGVVQRPVVAG